MKLLVKFEACSEEVILAPVLQSVVRILFFESLCYELDRSLFFVLPLQQ